MIDKAMMGWKEYELELFRDKNDNVVIICSIENMDPMGIHTGDSITVAPAMTLSDSTFQKMRNMAIKMMRSIGDFEVDLIGVDINAINITEDREQFRELMGRIGVAMAPQATATSFLRGKEIAQDFGFPLCIRSSFTLGGA